MLASDPNKAVSATVVLDQADSFMVVTETLAVDATVKTPWLSMVRDVAVTDPSNFKDGLLPVTIRLPFTTRAPVAAMLILHANPLLVSPEIIRKLNYCELFIFSANTQLRFKNEISLN